MLHRVDDSMKNRVLQWLKANYIPIVFTLIAVIIELTAVAVTGSKFFIRSPWMYLTVLAMLTIIQFFMSSQKKRYIYTIVVLSVIFALDLVFIIIFELTGTIFDFSMLNFNSKSDAGASLKLS